MVPYKLIYQFCVQNTGKGQKKSRCGVHRDLNDFISFTVHVLKNDFILLFTCYADKQAFVDNFLQYRFFFHKPLQ